MPRQVKIGFDKVPAPLTKSFHQLVDIKGTPLTDAAGNPLVTEENARNLAFTISANSLPAVVGNKGKDEAIPVIEVFGADSEVSTTLLGVTRAEEQLSLFADVSTYGLDRTNWNYYTDGQGRLPREWYNRAHPVFGKRGPAKFYEETTEQALYLKSFPTQYQWPDHPDSTEEIPLPTSEFGKYIRFIVLGRWLYEIWHPINSKFAEDNFLNPSLQILNVSREEVPITKDLWASSGTNGSWVNEGDFRTVVYGDVRGYTSQDAMNQIEKWTLFYFRIRNDEDTYPDYTILNNNGTYTTYQFKTPVLVGDPNLLPPYVGEYLAIQKYCRADFTRPGGSENNNTTGVLESRKTFRYQPGRVSGFTFGLRLKNNPREQSDKIEWGCSNDTDQYMFQVTGSQFNIIRRSTLRIPDATLEDHMGLIPADEFRTPITDLRPNSRGEREEPQQPPGVDNSEEMYEVRIPRSKWNGDPLNGQGPSGYIIDLVNVTMYKIEFSWYGAIGAKFYAYVPIGNGECRWVLMHTWVIENQLEKPSLKAADFKFRYVVFNNKTSNLTEPSYIYKYGSSYYIDGGDEGNITLSGTTSDTRGFSRTVEFPTATGSVLGLHPKTRILNSYATAMPNSYNGVMNNKKVYPMSLAAISDKNVRIDIKRVKVSPDGQHGTKSVSLASSDRFDKPINVRIVNRNKFVFTDAAGTSPDPLLTVLDRDAKLIGRGLLNMYAQLTSLGGNSYVADQASITRRLDDSYISRLSDVSDRIQLDRNTFVDLDSGNDQNVFSGFLSGFRSVTGSATPITSNRFKVHFLNPRKYDGRFPFHTHFADFAIGFTTDQPTEHVEVDGDDTISVLKFGDRRVYYTDPPDPENPGDPTVFDTGEYFDVNDELHVQFSNNTHLRLISTTGEFREIDDGDGIRFEQDYRIDGIEQPFNGTQGSAGCINGSISTIPFAATIDEGGTPPGQYPDALRIIFEDGFPPITEGKLGVAEVGVNEVGTGYVYVSIPVRENVGGVNKFVSYIDKRDAQVPTINAASITSVQAKVVTLTDDNKISNADPSKDFTVSTTFEFNVLPLYMFIGMRANARINNIIVEEITETANNSHVPNFKGLVGEGAGTLSEILEESTTGFNVPGKESSNIGMIRDPQTDYLKSPSNFFSNDRLSGVKYDVSTDLPLADGDILYSFFVGENEAVDFGLENIFNIDRAVLTPGLYNNNAIYFKANPVAGSGADASVNVQMTVTCKEQ